MAIVNNRRGYDDTALADYLPVDGSGEMTGNLKFDTTAREIHFGATDHQEHGVVSAATAGSLLLKKPNNQGLVEFGLVAGGMYFKDDAEDEETVPRISMKELTDGGETTLHTHPAP